MEIDLKVPADREIFLIVQQGKEEFVKEEILIAADIGVKDVDFTQGFGIYRTKEDAIAVAKILCKNKSSRQLAVVSAIK